MKIIVLIILKGRISKYCFKYSMEVILGKSALPGQHFQVNLPVKV
jgi:hypothetical protein